MLALIIAFTTLILGFAFFSTVPAWAQCPVCTVAIGGSVLLSRYLGIDDLIIGIWV